MKKWYESKTIWVNFIAFIGILLQGIFHKEVLSGEAQAMILALVNFLLRLITKHGLFEEGE
jgi:hypothetical protein